MKAAMYYGPHDLRIEEVAKPVPREGEVLVKVAWCVPGSLSTFQRRLTTLELLRCGICGTGSRQCPPRQTFPTC